MAPYDSDSSFEDEDFTETSVLLGYASKEATGDAISQLGGYPTWPDEDTPPSGALAKCKVCNSFMSLLLQLNGDLPSRFPDHERRLYLFTCRHKACRRKDGSIRGIRGSRIMKSQGARKSSSKSKETTQEKDDPADIGAALFGVSSASTSTSANPFSTTSASSSSPSNPFASASSLAAKPAQKTSETISALSETFASKARISADPPSTLNSTPLPHEPWPAQSSFPKPFTNYSLDAEYETLDEPSTPEIPTQARVDGDAEIGESSNSGAGGTAEDKQLFESSMDKTFQRFADRLAQNPEQVLRYEIGGQPLLYSSSDPVGKLFDSYANASFGIKVTKGSWTSNGGSASGMPRCQNCGAERVFELQLVPHTITVLEEDEDVGLDGMDWGTVILGVCGKDCSPKNVDEGEVGYLEEWVGVQWEELAAKKSD